MAQPELDGALSSCLGLEPGKRFMELGSTVRFNGIDIMISDLAKGRRSHIYLGEGASSVQLDATKSQGVASLQKQFSTWLKRQDIAWFDALPHATVSMNGSDGPTPAGFASMMFLLALAAVLSLFLIGG